MGLVYGFIRGFSGYGLNASEGVGGLLAGQAVAQ